MRNSLLAALMAATILVPATADAQDNQGRQGEGRGRGRDAGTPGQPQQARGDFGARGNAGGSEQRRQFVERIQQRPQVQAEAQAQAGVQAGVQGQPQFQRQDRGDRGGYQGGRGDYRNGSAAPAQQAPAAQQAQPDRARGGAFSGYRGGQSAAQDDRRDGGRRDDRRGFENRGNDGRGYDRNDNRGNDRNGRGYNGYTGVTGYNGRNNNGYTNRAWSRDWRQDNRYNYSNYRSQNRNAFRLPRYYAPYGWNSGYRRFGIGFTLSSILFDQDYWIDDPFDYRLPPAYGEYRWVRYYNDALLVDLRSGYVVDTVYDIFW